MKIIQILHHSHVRHKPNADVRLFSKGWHAMVTEPMLKPEY